MKRNDIPLNLHSQYCLCKIACSVLKLVSVARCIENITCNDTYIKAMWPAVSLNWVESG